MEKDLTRGNQQHQLIGPFATVKQPRTRAGVPVTGRHVLNVNNAPEMPKRPPSRDAALVSGERPQRQSLESADRGHRKLDSTSQSQARGSPEGIGRATKSARRRLASGEIAEKVASLS